MLAPKHQELSSPFLNGFLVALAMFASALLGVGWLSMKAVNSETKSIQSDVELIAKSAVTVIDLDKYKKLLTGSATDYDKNLYAEVISPLINIHNAIKSIQYLYTMDHVDGKEYFILDTATFPDRLKVKRQLKSSAFKEEYKDKHPLYDEMLKAFKQEGAFVDDKPNTDSYGTFMTAYVPIIDKDGTMLGHLGADFDIKEYSKELNDIKNATITALSIAFFLSGFIGFGVSRLKRRSNDLQKLSRDAESQFRNVVDNIPGAIFQLIVNAKDNYKFSYMSPRCFDTFGFTSVDAIKDWNMIPFYPIDLVKFRNSLEAAISKKISQWTFEGRILTRQDEVQWFRLVSKSELRQNGSIFFNGIMLDITKEKSAEELLEKSRERLRQVIENNNLIDYNVSFNGELLYISHVCADILGYKPEELVGQSSDFIIHNQDKDEYNRVLKHTLLTGKMTKDLIYRVRHKNGNWLWFSSNLSIVIDSNHQPIYFGGIAADITKRRQAEIEAESTKSILEQTNKELLVVNRQLEKSIDETRKFAKEVQIANKAKSDFLATMSHEIRTPLNSIIGFTSVLLSLNLSQEQLELVERIRLGGDNLLLLVNDILDFSKIEAGLLDLEQNSFEISSCLNEVKDLLLRSANEKNLSLSLNIEKLQHHFVVGDVNRLRQILVNIVSNAIKFTNSGSISIEVISKDLSPVSCSVTFVVSDSGIGMSKEQTEKLFRPFVQADSSTTRKFGGTGLGLAICKRLCDLMKGSIWVESELNVGSKFYISLPFTVSESSEDVKKDKRPKVPVIEKLADTIPLKVLVADDNSTNQRVAGLFLEKMGYRADFVSNGKEVLDAVDRQVYDIIFMDVQMPEMDGLTATEIIRKNEAISGKKPMYIIALTAFAMQEDKEKCLKSGMNSYLTKPIKIENLAASLKEYAKTMGV